MNRDKEVERRSREKVAVQEARRKQECVTYKDDDGCEITATPEGHIFYNVTDWW